MINDQYETLHWGLSLDIVGFPKTFYINEAEDRGLLELLKNSEGAQVKLFWTGEIEGWGITNVYRCVTNWKPWEIIELSLSFDTRIICYIHKSDWGTQYWITPKYWKNPQDWKAPNCSLRYRPRPRRSFERKPQ